MKFLPLYNYMWIFERYIYETKLIGVEFSGLPKEWY